MIVNVNQSIDKAPQVEFSTAVIPENRAKNRFGNIYPCMCYDYNFESVLDVLNNLTIHVANNDTFAYVKLH